MNVISNGGRAILGLVLAAALVGCSKKEPWPSEVAPPGAASAAVTVTTGAVVVRPVQRWVEAVGTMWGYEEVVIAAKVEGRIRTVKHDVSEWVSAGEPLIEIDPTDFELAVRQAEKALQVDLVRLGLTELPTLPFDVTKVPSVVQAAARMEQAKQKVEKFKAVGSNASSEELADRVTDHRVAAAEYDNQVLAAKAGLTTVQLKQEALAIARRQLTEAVVRAPTPTQPLPGGAAANYVISQRNVSEGSYVRPGTELMRLVIAKQLKLRVPVPERHSAEVKKGQAVDVVTAAHATPFEGIVNRVNPSVDASTRTFEVEVLVPNAKDELKSGGFAKARIRTRLDPKATTVPLESVVSFAGVTKLFLIEDGKAKEIRVTVGIQDERWIEIVAPALQPGAKIATSGLSSLSDGSSVVER